MGLVKDIFFSGTFGGETISVTITIAVIEKYKKYNFISRLETQRKKLFQPS